MQCTHAAHCTTFANLLLGGSLAGGDAELFGDYGVTAAASVLRLVAPSVDVDDDVGGLA